MIHESKTVASKKKLRMIFTTAIAVILAIVIFASTAFAGLVNNYNVDIIDNGVKTTVTTSKTEATDILADAGVSLTGSDKVDISNFEAGGGGSIVIDRVDIVNIEVGSSITAYNVYSNTVGEALDEIGIALNDGDTINYELTDSVVDGMVINIQTAFKVNVKVDGVTTEYAMVDGTVGDLLASAGVALGTDDYTKPAVDAQVEAGATVKVYRVTYKDVTETEEVKYETTQQDDSSMTKGETEVVTKGENGEASVTYNVKYVNGKEKERKETSRTVSKEAKAEVVKVGTKEVEKKETTTSAPEKSSEKTTSSSKSTSSSDVKSNGVTSKNGRSVGEVISGKYTHYCACSICNGNSRGITSSGKKISNGMANPYYVACNWLPLGTVIDVDGTNYTVVDRGGSGLSTIGRIDIFTPEGHKACYKYGTGKCTITIVRLGW